MAGLPATGQTGTTTPLPPIGSGNTLNGLTQYGSYQPQSRAEATAGLDYAFQGGHIDDAQRQQMLGQFDTMQWQQPALPAFTGKDFAQNIGRQIVGLDTPWATDSSQFLAADVNKDGKINSSDMTDHLRYVAGLETPGQEYNYNQLATAIKPKSAGRGETAEEYAARDDVKLYNQRINAAPAQTGEQVYNEWLKNNPQPIQQPVEPPYSPTKGIIDYLGSTDGSTIGSGGGGLGANLEATKAQAGYGSIPEGVLGATQPVIGKGNPWANATKNPPEEDTTPDWMTKVARDPTKVYTTDMRMDTFTNPETGETFVGDARDYQSKFGAPDAKTGGTPAPEPTAEQKRQQEEALQKQMAGAMNYSPDSLGGANNPVQRTLVNGTTFHPEASEGRPMGSDIPASSGGRPAGYTEPRTVMLS